MDLQISLNGQQYAPLLLPLERFTYLQPVVVESLSPAGGPITGGTRVVLTGNWTAGQTQGGGGAAAAAAVGARATAELLRCRFGREVVRASRRAEDGALLCETPAAPMGSPLWNERAATTAALPQGGPQGGTGTPSGGTPSGGTPSGGTGESPVVSNTLVPLGGWQLGDSLIDGSGNPFFAQDTGLERLTAPDRGDVQLVEVSLNGLDYSAGGLVQWRWLLPARAIGHSPVSGPVHGGTTVVVTGENFFRAPELRCRFGAVVVNASVRASWYDTGGGASSADRHLEATCESPPAASSSADGPVPLLLSLNGQEYFDDGLAFAYHRVPPPDYRPLHPTFGPLLGGTVVLLPGTYTYGTDLACRVGGVGGVGGQVVAAQFAAAGALRQSRSLSGAHGAGEEASAEEASAEEASAEEASAGGGTAAEAASAASAELTCTMPSTPRDALAAIELSLNGQQYMGAADGFDQRFAYHSPMNTIGVAPFTGPAAGSTELIVRLDNVSLSARQLLAEHVPQYICRFDERWHVATLDEPPPFIGAAGNATAIDGSTVHVVVSNLSSHYAFASLNATCSGGADGSTPTFVGGNALACTDPLQLLTLRCTAPPAAALSPPTLQPRLSASLNAQDFTPSLGASFLYYPPQRVSSVQPTTGPRDGGTLLAVRGGSLFGHGENLLCRFDQLPPSPDGAMPTRAAGALASAAEQRRALVAMSQQIKPFLNGLEYLPHRYRNSAPAIYSSLPVLTQASWDAPTESLRCYSPPASAAEGYPLLPNETFSSPLAYRLEVSANGQ